MSTCSRRRALALSTLLFAAAQSARAGEPTPLPRRTLAVSYFDNNSGDAALDPLAKGLADMLITDLGVIASLQIVERAKLDQMLKELDLSRSKFIDPKTALRLGKGLAASFILAGGFVVANEELRVDVRIFEVDSGRVVASEKIAGPKDDFFALEKDLVQLLVKAVDVKLDAREKSALRRNPTESFEAFRQYSNGLALTDRGETERAQAAFRAALAADPGYQAARDAMGRLQAILALEDVKQARTWDESVVRFKALDPQDPRYGEKLFMLFSQLDGSAGDLKKEIELLQWLQDKKLEPRFFTTSPVPFRALGIAWILTDDPEMEDAILKTCEYFIGAYPNDAFPKTYCRTILEAIEDHRQSATIEERKARLAEQAAWHVQNRKPGDRGRELFEQREPMKRLLRGYAARVKR